MIRAGILGAALLFQLGKISSQEIKESITITISIPKSTTIDKGLLRQAEEYLKAQEWDTACFTDLTTVKYHYYLGCLTKSYLKAILSNQFNIRNIAFRIRDSISSGHTEDTSMFAIHIKSITTFDSISTYFMRSECVFYKRDLLEPVTKKTFLVKAINEGDMFCCNENLPMSCLINNSCKRICSELLKLFKK